MGMEVDFWEDRVWFLRLEGFGGLEIIIISVLWIVGLLF